MKCPVVAESWPEVEDICLDVAVDPVRLDISTWRSFEFTSRIVDLKSVGAAELDGVRSRSKADFRGAEVVVGTNVVGNDVVTGRNTVLDISPENVLGGSTRGLLASGSMLSNPELAGAAEIDGVRSRSEADFRGNAEMVAGNNAEIRFNTRGPPNVTIPAD